MIIYRVTDGVNDYGFYRLKEDADKQAEKMIKRYGMSMGVYEVRVDMGRVAQKSDEPSEEERPRCKCGALMKKKRGKYGEFWGCPTYPLCHYSISISRPPLFDGDDESNYDDWVIDAFDITDTF